MNVPVVLPTVRVAIDQDGMLSVTVDNAAYAEGRQLTRGDLSDVVAEIAAGLGSPIRIEATEADGTTYADIATPPPPEVGSDGDPADAGTCAEDHQSVPGISGRGFDPGETVAIAYVLGRQTADAEGTAQLRLPTASLTSARLQLILIGLSSGAVAHPTAPR